MLVLLLEHDDHIVINGPCVIKLDDRRINRAKLAFDAPKTTRIMRGKAIVKEMQEKSRETGLEQTKINPTNEELAT